MRSIIFLFLLNPLLVQCAEQVPEYQKKQSKRVSLSWSELIGSKTVQPSIYGDGEPQIRQVDSTTPADAMTNNLRYKNIALSILKLRTSWFGRTNKHACEETFNHLIYNWRFKQFGFYDNDIKTLLDNGLIEPYSDCYLIKPLVAAYLELRVYREDLTPKWEIDIFPHDICDDPEIHTSPTAVLSNGSVKQLTGEFFKEFFCFTNDSSDHNFDAKKFRRSVYRVYIPTGRMADFRRLLNEMKINWESVEGFIIKERACPQ
jgi:hypothetical protein